MKNSFIMFCFIITGIVGLNKANGQEMNLKDSMMVHMPQTPVHKVYIASAMDGAIFQTASVQRPYRHDTWGTLRFSYFINFGVTVNYDFNNLLGVYAGLDIKNIGFIEKRKDSTIKHRTYNVGIPVGIKIGNMKNRCYGFAGAGIDAPINYREKSFVERNNKSKFNEWWSDRTPHFMPYIFAGVSMKPGFSLKVQYYLNNYMNPDFTTTDFYGTSYKPYGGYNVHMLLISLGINMPYTKPMMYGDKKNTDTSDDDEI